MELCRLEDLNEILLIKFSSKKKTTGKSKNKLKNFQLRLLSSHSRYNHHQNEENNELCLGPRILPPRQIVL